MSPSLSEIEVIFFALVRVGVERLSHSPIGGMICDSFRYYGARDLKFFVCCFYIVFFDSAIISLILQKRS